MLRLGELQVVVVLALLAGKEANVRNDGIRGRGIDLHTILALSAGS